MRPVRMLQWALWGFLALYGLALLVLLIGTFGLFGQARDPLSGVFLIPLGWPWNLVADRLLGARLAAALLAPAVNALLLFALWRWARASSRVR